MIGRYGELALRWLAALVLVILILLKPLHTTPSPVPTPPSPCWETQLQRIAGDKVPSANKTSLPDAKNCYPPRAEGLGLSPKADIAVLRHRGLFKTFFNNPRTLPLQRRTVAAQLLVDYDARVAAFTALTAENQFPEMVWRAKIALAFTHLRYGKDAAARAAAQRALATVTDNALPTAMAADAHYVLGLTSSERVKALRHFVAARRADPFFFDAHLRILVDVVYLLREQTNPTTRLALLDTGLKSIDYLNALDDRGLLVELQLNWPHNSALGGRESALLDAYMRWYSGRTDEAKQIMTTAMAGCRTRTPICNRLNQLLNVMRAADNG